MFVTSLCKNLAIQNLPNNWQRFWYNLLIIAHPYNLSTLFDHESIWQLHQLVAAWSDEMKVHKRPWARTGNSVCSRLFLHYRMGTCSCWMAFSCVQHSTSKEPNICTFGSIPTSWLVEPGNRWTCLYLAKQDSHSRVAIQIHWLSLH